MQTAPEHPPSAAVVAGAYSDSCATPPCRTLSHTGLMPPPAGVMPPPLPPHTGLMPPPPLSHASAWRVMHPLHAMPDGMTLHAAVGNALAFEYYESTSRGRSAWWQLSRADVLVPEARCTRYIDPAAAGAGADDSALSTVVLRALWPGTVDVTLGERAGGRATSVRQVRIEVVDTLSPSLHPSPPPPPPLPTVRHTPRPGAVGADN